MYQYQYARQRDIEALTTQFGISISELAMRHEAERDETETAVIAD